jgi:integrase
MAKHKQRGHGEGSIYQRKDGRWVASLPVDAGSRKRKYLYGKSRKEAHEKLHKALQEQKQGLLITGPQQTVRQFLEYWLEEVHRPRLRKSTYAEYRRTLDKVLFPALGHVQLQKLTAEQVQALYTRKLKEGLASKSVRNIHSVLHTALNYAVRTNRVARNVCDSVSPPISPRHEIQPLTDEQAHKLLEAAQGHRLEALLVLALTTGMRRGELLGLRWRDIDFEKRSLQVRRTVTYLAKYGFVEGESKTLKSRRKIVLPYFVVNVLKQHRAMQLEARFNAGAVWVDHDLVFCNWHGGFLAPMILFKKFTALLKDAGLPYVRFHDLRHSAATILLSMGVHPKVVQEILGHSQISITMDTYSHVLPSMQEGAMDNWDEWFKQN